MKKLKALDLLKTLRDDYIHGELTSDIEESIVELEALSCDNCKYNIDVSDLSDEESLNIKENCLNCCNFYTNKKEI